ncbi:four helix bundle protein [Clostridium bornimense]|uniref:four helix bundle protein n=1 Tax=Clostridium bornimense TaxID=1216932 RepID=UPI001C12808F|nr:four helix bundle protein [Clostridium bornimense]MBU5316444.1 four helix bundle protein [Clostridium bornimense]
MNENILENKSFDFALDIMKLYKRLTSTNNENVIFKQLIRSSTSIGANIKEALRGESRKDFTHKLSISLKEANETEYWLELLIASEYIEYREGKELLAKCKELCKILYSIVRTLNKNKS